MKVKEWLRKYKNMDIATYHALDKYEQYELQAEHADFCCKEQIRKAHAHEWRPMTKEEKEKTDAMIRVEREKWKRDSLARGTEGAHYVALHHRK